ncbi:MAG: hypothetical protein II994_05075 [Lachnospiraceae bacterium]|nr:hypothetical protein [Lachnospiraceae bacterium]
MISLLKEMVSRRRIKLLLLVEAVVLLLCVIGLFGKNEIYEYGMDRMTIRFGNVDEENGSVSADPSLGQVGNMVDFEGISLPAGLYRVCLKYQTDTDMENACTVSDVSLGYRSLLTNGDLLYAGLQESDFDMWLLRGTKQLTVHASYYGVGNLQVSGLTIYETNGLNRMLLFWAILCFAVADAALVLREYDRKYGFSKEQKNVFFGLILTIFFANLPNFTDYLVSTADGTFHYWRIEGLKEGLLSGQFPVRISEKWQYGYGYAAPIFYGETFLVPAAIFRMIGFTVTDSYRYYLLLINAATVLIAYYCFGKVLKSRYLGLFASMLYTISVYRIHKVYCRGTLGEALALMLLPLLVYGFYKVFTEDIHTKEYKWNWIPLTIGYAGLLQSHLLTGEMAGAFTILLCLVMWKKVFRWPTFKVLAQTVIFAVLISAWFIVPFADYMLTGDMKIEHAGGRRIQERGVLPAHLFMTFFSERGEVFFAETGMYRTDATGISIALVVILGIWAFLAFFGYTKKMLDTDRKLAGVLAGFSGLAMLLSLSAFPWDRIQFLSPITETLVSSLEFPDRILTMANLCLALLGGLLGKYLLQKENAVWKWSYFGGMTALVFLSSVYLMNGILYDTGFARIYNEGGMGYGYVSSGEYLPYGTQTSLITFREPFGEGVEVNAWSRDGLTLQIACENVRESEGALEVPLLYYKGYHAYDAESGEELAVAAGNNFAATVTLPVGYGGEVLVCFIPPWYWRAGEVVSLLSVVMLAGFRVKWKKENGKHA